MQDDQQTPATNQAPHPSPDDNYRRLREGSREFDPKTADALLMQVNMDAATQLKQQTGDRKQISFTSALLFPWRLFDPTAPSSARRVAVVLLILVILTVIGAVLPSLIT